ncbi:GNAT family N-acetyltransferase [Paenibacillus aceris]|uniref:GNAT superfamily N-acetyltransferase n=1 Tax=Paenibacillus aceris TaxID=869555 RepID=A0ABS4I0J1_9BACL|nr:GNAT family N-acetyltransferase [Paenibacillus aceris]MBP1964438.1 GNAT superfamily N-acetyltransferase [Paenibacillus aceris]NHW35848.1 GNAT family N-acetyltransferase [Paenibacillus aceris]
MMFKKMSELTAEDMVVLWNKGFEGYPLNNTLTLDRFFSRAVNEGLSFEHSLVMFERNEPIGFVMNGFRSIEGKKVTWNGGTGIVPAYRGKGFGKQLMERNLQLYREQEAGIALLEALVHNETAIKLYRSVGYEITEQLVCLQRSEAIDASLLETNAVGRYSTRRGLPIAVREVPFYRPMSAWQTQWPSMKDGESIIVTDGEEVVGYALCKRIFGEDGHLATIALYQCEALPGREDEREILKTTLSEVFAPLTSSFKRLTMNIRHTNSSVHELLEELGFSSFVEQVHMLRQM